MKLGFSPCPNDTFIFDAIVNKKIDLENLNIDSIITDVENLNNMALDGELDITKLSFQTYFKVKNYYSLLNSGSALGRNCGPLLISKKHYSANELNDLKIAIPGINTTANLLLTIAFPGIQNKLPMLFSDIEDAILLDEADAGAIIHENRFTYHDKGLSKIIDLGEYWEKITGLPLPLGCIVVRKDLGDDIKNAVERVMKRSVEFALQNPESGLDFVKAHSKSLSDDIIKKHIKLYVNNFTVDLGAEGRSAIDRLEQMSRK
jgi:1,4-dihydroxy-6-naphthoate synthase